MQNNVRHAYKCIPQINFPIKQTYRCLFAPFGAIASNVYKQKHVNCNRYFQIERVYKLILFISNDK